MKKATFQVELDKMSLRELWLTYQLNTDKLLSARQAKRENQVVFYEKLAHIVMDEYFKRIDQLEGFDKEPVDGR